MKKTITLDVNGAAFTVDVDPWDNLLTVLRDQIGLMGTKYGCGAGDCGACTVLVDGVPLDSCLLLAIRLEGRRILTIEGLQKNGELHPLQESFLVHGALQCGYCTPGMILSAKALLDRNRNPSDQEIRSALAGNLCRCTGYKKIIEAVKAAAASLG